MKDYELALYLLKCAVNSQKPKLPDDCDMDALWQFCISQSIAATVAKPLLDHKLLADEDQYQLWAEAYYKNLNKTLAFDTERAIIEKKLDSLGIWHAPLKGIIFNKLYPFSGMREFADNDILVEDGHRKEISEMMEQMGYISEKNKSSSKKDDCFYKEPFFNFEIHYGLFGPKIESEKFINYYSDVSSMLRRCGDSRYSYRFSDEDFYVFSMVHAYKHYIYAGIGVRTFADIYTFRRKIALNEEYLRCQFKKLEIDLFADMVESISNKLFSAEHIFSTEVLTESESELLSDFINSGTYGTFQKSIESNYRNWKKDNGKGGRLRYFKSRLFPGVESLKETNPVVYRHKILYPAYLVYRPFRGIATNRKKLAEEIKTIAHIKKNKEK